MKLAFLVLCHKSPEQLNTLLDVLKHPDVSFFINIDKKSDIEPQIKKREDIFILPYEKRTDVKWGTFSQVEASLSLLRYVDSKGSFDYFWLVSGQDFPLKSIETILSYLSENTSANYINLVPSKNNGTGHSNNYDKRNEIFFTEWLLKRTRLRRIIRRGWVEITGGYSHTFRIFKRAGADGITFYFGSAWWCFNAHTVKWMLEYLDAHSEYINFFHKSSCPDECFYQTLFMNSPFINSRHDYLHYIVWPKGCSSPKNLDSSDYETMISSERLMARKIDGDEFLLKKLVENAATE